MKTKKIAIFVSFIILFSCNNVKQQNIEKTNNQNDSLNAVIGQLEYRIRCFERDNPFVEKLHTEAPTCMIIQFKPIGLVFKLHSSRPFFNNETYLCVPAAFTSPQKTIEGIFVKNGVLINNIRNEKINGFVSFKNDDFIIDKFENLTDSIIETAKIKKLNLFQQILLVKEKKIVKCNIFKNKENTRRAIVKYQDGEVFIAESHRPMTILEFQSALVEIGVVDAIYLDMGTWSEGWYKSSDCEQIKIGENFSNTNRQTNWLTFEKEK